MNTKSARTVIIIPTFNEQASIGHVLDAIPMEYRNPVIVVDNGSTDATAAIAAKHGAIVIHEPRRGYGSACLAGIAHAKVFSPDVHVFLDGDYSDYPEDLPNLLDALDDQNLDLVIGSRMLGLAEKGALLPQARFGNWLATQLMAIRYRYRFTDLGPFRAIRTKALEQLQMADTNFGWTMEMQVKALRSGLHVGEVPVRYRKRIGESKISGTISGSVAAGIKILWTLGRYSFPHAQKPKQYETHVG